MKTLFTYVSYLLIGLFIFLCFSVVLSKVGNFEHLNNPHDTKNEKLKKQCLSVWYDHDPRFVKIENKTYCMILKNGKREPVDY